MDGTQPKTRGVEGDLQPGQVVGEYVVESKLGQGGFGSVFRASHPLIGKLAAIKVLSRQWSADPDMVSRFVEEARAVNQIRHRGIIDIFSFGQLEDGRSYYVMELLDGRTLDKLIKETGGFSLADAIPILRALARALDAAHAKGIAHRDLKPENVFLATQPDGAPFPKLLDFGIAKLTGDRSTESKHKTATGAPIGTPCYMSPEQCRGRDVDHRTDIYAFGCVAYEMLTGKLPFDADDHLTVMMKQLSEEPVPASQLVSLPEGVDDVLSWLLRKEPGERPPDLITAINALSDVAQAAGIVIPGDEAPPSGRLTPVPGRLTPVPGRLTPVPGRPTPTPGSHTGFPRAATPFEGAPTIAPVSGEMPTLPAPPPSRSTKLIPIIAIAAALIIGTVTFLMLRGDDSETAAKTEPVAPVAAPAPPPVAPPPVAPPEPAIEEVAVPEPVEVPAPIETKPEIVKKPVKPTNPTKPTKPVVKPTRPDDKPVPDPYGRK